MPDLESGEQLRRAAEALAAARAAARARGARPVPRARPVAEVAAAAGEAADGEAADGGPSLMADHGDSAISSATAASAGRQDKPRPGGSAAPTEIDPDGAEPVPGGAAEPSVRPARSVATRSHARAAPGFAPQPRRAEPVSLSSAISGLLDAEGWTLAAATGSVFGRWAEIVGADLAGHTRPERLADGELTVVADSTAWATQVRLLAPQLVQRLNRELGDGTVLGVRVRGPAPPNRATGRWRVRGGRGPRDTYG